MASEIPLPLNLVRFNGVLKPTKDIDRKKWSLTEVSHKLPKAFRTFTSVSSDYRIWKEKAMDVTLKAHHGWRRVLQWALKRPGVISDDNPVLPTLKLVGIRRGRTATGEQRTRDISGKGVEPR